MRSLNLWKYVTLSIAILMSCSSLVVWGQGTLRDGNNVLSYAKWKDSLGIESNEKILLSGEIENNYVRLQTNEYGQFHLSLLDGSDLIFDNWYSSFSTIRVDGTDYDNYKHSFDTEVSPPTDNGTVNTGVWTVASGKIRVTQSLSLVNGSSTGNQDTIEIKYTVQNNDSTAHEIGVRVMLDTKLGSNDSAPFKVPSIGDVTTESEWLAGNIPPYYQAFDSLTDPQIQSQGTLIGGSAIVPDRFVICKWSRVDDTPWEFTINEGESNGDSAVAMYWNPVSIGAGQSRTVITYYGLGGIDINTEGSLAVGLTADATLSVVENRLSPNPFTLTAYIENTVSGFDQTAENVYAQLNLPAGLSLDASETTRHDLGSIERDQGTQTSWRILASGNPSGLLTYSVEVGGDNLETESYPKTVYIPELVTPTPTSTPLPESYCQDGDLTLRLDNNQPDNHLGITSDTRGYPMLWLNRYELGPEDYPITLESFTNVWIETGSNLVGSEAAGMLIYLDSDGDGDPSNAVKIADQEISLPNPSDTLRQRHDWTTPVQVTGSGDLYIGFVDLQSGQDEQIRFMATQDNSGQGTKSFLIYRDDTDPIDLDSLSNNAHILNMGDSGYANAWVLRGIGSCNIGIDPTPTFSPTPTQTPTPGPTMNPSADIDGSGCVDWLDLYILMQNWQRCE